MDNAEDIFQKERIVKKKSDDEVDLVTYLRVIFKYYKMILLVSIFAVVATAIFVFTSPKFYSANTSILPPMEFLRKDSTLSSGLLGAGGSSILRKAIDVTSIAYMYVGILESRAVADAIVDRFNLMKIYSVNGRSSVARAMLGENSTFKISNEGILTIAVRDADPNRAAAIANAYVEELDLQNKRLSAGQATSKRVFLENRLKEVEKKLSEIENILSREAKVQEMLYELLIREYEIAKIEEAKSMPTIQVLDKAIVPEARIAGGNVRKTALAGIVSFVIAVVLAFVRENLPKIKKIDSEENSGFVFRSKRGSTADSAFSELESKRKIVGAQRRRRVQEEESYSRGV